MGALSHELKTAEEWVGTKKCYDKQQSNHLENMWYLGLGDLCKTQFYLTSSLMNVKMRVKKKIIIVTYRKWSTYQ